MTNINENPRWNLDSLYKNLDSEEYKKDFAELKSLIEKEESLLKTQKQTEEGEGRLPFEEFLNSYLEADNQLSSIFKTLSAYAYIIYSTDTTNPEYMNNLNKMDDISTDVQQLYIKFAGILDANKNQLENFYSKNPDKKQYEYLLNEIIFDRQHQMSLAEEELAGKMGHTGANAWSLLQEQIISNLHDEKGKTFNELRNDANDKNPELRYESWKKEVELLDQNKIAFAAALNNLKGEKVTLNKKRGWAYGLEKSLFLCRVNKTTLDALIGAIEDSLPVWRNYFKAKAKLLRKAGATVSKTAGTDEHKGIAFYDLFAPVENPDKTDGKKSVTTLISKNWTFNEACDYVVKEYYSFSDEMGDFAKAAVKNGWIDAQVRAGKVGGAYDEDFPKGHQSRVLTNFTGVFSDVITLAHELGHAYHFSCMKGKPAVFFDYPMTLAESASTFAETIVKQDMLSQSSGFDRIKIMDLDLTDTSQVLVDILCRFYFERSVFEAKENGNELNAEDFCRLMEEAQQKSYGDGLNDEKTADGYAERHNFMWAVKSHYYIPDLDFYNFPYAFGQLFAAGLYAKSRSEGKAFAKTYAGLLSNTGNMSCEELCAKAGFDISSKKFWKSGIEMYEKEVKEYCNFVDSI